MAEYIEREAFRREIDEHRPGRSYEDAWALTILDSIPAADVRPMVLGEWEEDCVGAAVCSVCGKYAFETSTHHLCGWFPNFCPNCGADMREES